MDDIVCLACSVLSHQYFSRSSVPPFSPPFRPPSLGHSCCSPRRPVQPSAPGMFFRDGLTDSGGSHINHLIRMAADVVLPPLFFSASHGCEDNCPSSPAGLLRAGDVVYVLAFPPYLFSSSCCLPFGFLLQPLRCSGGPAIERGDRRFPERGGSRYASQPCSPPR